MPGNTAKGRVTKPSQKTRKSRDKRADGSSDYAPSLQDGDEPESQTLDVIEKKVKELKKTAVASKNHAEKFRKRTEAVVQETIEDWKTHQEKIMKSSREWDEELNAVFENALAGNKSLETLQESMMSMAQELTEKHNALQNTISSALNRELILGDGWQNDGEDAIQVLSELTSEEQESVEKHLHLDDDGEYSNEGSWMDKVKRSEKGIKQALRAVPVPVALD